MSPEDFFNTYQSIFSSSSLKRNKHVDQGDKAGNLNRNTSLETLKLSVSIMIAMSMFIQCCTQSMSELSFV